MHLHSMTLVRIVAARPALPAIVALLEGAGASGFTVLPATGAGAHGARRGETDDTANVCIDCVTSEGRATEILRRVHAELFAQHPVIAYLQEARVIRRDKFL